jgi:hypothetical protein
MDELEGGYDVASSGISVKTEVTVMKDEHQSTDEVYMHVLERERERDGWDLQGR